MKRRSWYTKLCQLCQFNPSLPAMFWSVNVYLYYLSFIYFGMTFENRVTDVKLIMVKIIGKVRNAMIQLLSMESHKHSLNVQCKIWRRFVGTISIARSIPSTDIIRTSIRKRWPPATVRHAGDTNSSCTVISIEYTRFHHRISYTYSIFGLYNFWIVSRIHHKLAITDWHPSCLLKCSGLWICTSLVRLQFVWEVKINWKKYIYSKRSPLKSNYISNPIIWLLYISVSTTEYKCSCSRYISVLTLPPTISLKSNVVGDRSEEKSIFWILGIIH